MTVMGRQTVHRYKSSLKINAFKLLNHCIPGLIPVVQSAPIGRKFNSVHDPSVAAQSMVAELVQNRGFLDQWVRRHQMCADLYGDYIEKH